MKDRKQTFFNIMLVIGISIGVILTFGIAGREDYVEAVYQDNINQLNKIYAEDIIDCDEYEALWDSIHTNRGKLLKEYFE